MAEVTEAILEEWIQAFEALPEDRRENVKRWFATQKLIIEASGLEPETWFGYVEWALDHPFDYGFLEDFPDPGMDPTADAAERTDGTRRSRVLVGADTRVVAPEGEGMKEKATSTRGLERELFDNFMKNRLGRR